MISIRPWLVPLGVVLLLVSPGLSEEPTGELAQRLARVEAVHYAPAPGYSEGPTWVRGEVYFCSGALWRVDRNGQAAKYLELGPAGTVLRGDGHLLICDNKYKALLDLAPDGRVGVVVDSFESRPLRGLNDLTIDARGNVYWSDPEGSSLVNPVGNVYRLRPDGQVDRLATGLAFPNGLDVDPASEFLYVVESQSKKVLRYRLPADDALLGPAETFYDLGGSGGDGCTFDAAGNLWVTDFHRPETGRGRIAILEPTGKLLAYLPLPSKLVSNITFGGERRDEIFCTTADPAGVFHAQVGVPGFAGHPGRPLPIVRALDIIPLRAHPEAEKLSTLFQQAAAAKRIEGSWDDATRQSFVARITEIEDQSLRERLREFWPQVEGAIQRQAADQPLLAEIKRLKGRVESVPRAPRWLRELTGDQALAGLNVIVGLDLTDCEVTGETLGRLGDSLERLNLAYTNLDDSGLDTLSRLTQLRSFTATGTRVTPAGIARLYSRLPRLVITQ